MHILPYPTLPGRQAAHAHDGRLERHLDTAVDNIMHTLPYPTLEAGGARARWSP